MKGPAESGQICSMGRRKIAKKIAKISVATPPQLDSDDAAMTYERFTRCGSAMPVANYYEVRGGERVPASYEDRFTSTERLSLS
jgi:hypothetical protein